MTGPGQHTDMGKIEQLAPAMPVRQTSERIGADQEHERAFRADFGAQFDQRIDRVRRALAAQFSRVEGEAVLSDQGRANERRTLFGRRNGLIAMWRHPRWQQPYLGIQEFGGLPRDAQMRVVDRIEGAAKERERAQWG